MECKDIEQWLLEHDGEPLSEEVASHLAACADCHAWKRILDAIEEPAVQSVPSPSLDATVMTMASRELGWRRRLIWLRRGLTAVAACVVAALVVFGVMSRHSGIGVTSSGNVAIGGKSKTAETRVARADMEAAWDSLVMDCVNADDALYELEGNLGGIGRLTARATESSAKSSSYGVVFEDAVDLENSLTDLELVVYGL